MGRGCRKGNEGPIKTQGTQCPRLRTPLSASPGIVPPGFEARLHPDLLAFHVTTNPVIQRPRHLDCRRAADSDAWQRRKQSTPSNFFAIATKRKPLFPPSRIRLGSVHFHPDLPDGIQCRCADCVRPLFLRILSTYVAPLRCRTSRYDGRAEARNEFL